MSAIAEFKPSPRTAACAPSSRAGVARLATAARLAHLRPARAVRVEDPTTIKTGRLMLRPLRADDRREFMRVLRASRRHLASFCPLDKREDGVVSDGQVFERQLLLSARALETGLAWRRIALDDRGRIAGAVAINDIRRGLEHSGELVFWIGVDHAGRGLASECVEAATRVAFGDLPRGLGLHRLTALVDPANARSLRVLRRFGFSLRPQSVPIDLVLSGRRAPHDVYAAFAPLAEPARRPIGDQRRLIEALASILHTEAAQGACSPALP